MILIIDYVLLPWTMSHRYSISEYIHKDISLIFKPNKYASSNFWIFP